LDANWKSSPVSPMGVLNPLGNFLILAGL
jgi:hypothetical protein